MTHTTKSEYTEVVVVRVTPEQREQVRELARREQRSMSTMFRMLVEEPLAVAVAERGMEVVDGDVCPGRV